MDDSGTREINGKLEVNVPEDMHTAGSPNVVRVVIHNPFPVPVEILEIQAPRSTFIRRSLERGDATSTPEGDRTLQPASSNNRGQGWRRFLDAFASASLVVSGVSIGGVRAEFPKSQRSLELLAEANSELELDRDLDGFEVVRIKAEEGAKIKVHARTDDENHGADEVNAIQPHCDKVAYFSIASNSWLFFTPQRTNLSTEIKYRIQGEERTQVVNSYFDIKPPLRSMIVGSVIGGFLGSLARMLQVNGIQDFRAAGLQLGAAVTMSLIAAIALSRKSGTQGFITVEDFFGAFVVGSLIGYGGSEYFDRALLPAGE